MKIKMKYRQDVSCAKDAEVLSLSEGVRSQHSSHKR